MGVVGRDEDEQGSGQRVRRLGKYELLRPLAAGGMAELDLARVSGLGGFEKTVVLKRVHPRLSSSAESLRLLLQEARLVASLQHPNIAQVYDVGMANGQVFIAMEHVDGQDLRVLQWAAVRRDGGLPLAMGVAIAIGAAAGLHHAHEKAGPDGQPLGIVHRDVSPSNLLVSYDGWPKLVDFGIAKTSDSPALTKNGSVRGKTGYLSPEQCRCEPLDRRSDVFSLGVVLYELTTATRLYVGRSELEIMKRITEEPVPPPSSRRAAYPRQLERIVLRALAPERADRYQTAEEMQLDLEAFARERKLVVTAPELAKYMRGLFPDKGEACLAELRELRAQRERQAANAAAVTVASASGEAEAALEPGEPPTKRQRGLTASVPRSGSTRAAVMGAGLVMAAVTGVLAAMLSGGSVPGPGRAAYAAVAPATAAASPPAAAPVASQAEVPALAPLPAPRPAADTPAVKHHRPKVVARSRVKKLPSRPAGPLPLRLAVSRQPERPKPAASRAEPRQGLLLDPWPTR